MRLGYLYSRYPVISQTFCDMEMLELERRGFDLVIGSIHAPLTSLRHAHVGRLHSPLIYAPPSPILRVWERKTKEEGRWPEALIEEHRTKFGERAKPELRARNASYFAALFAAQNVDHFHVHFANRAAHTAIFLKEISGIPFSVTAHGQDFMSDLDDDNLLRAICDAADFVAVETDYSRGLLQKRCPEAALKIHRVYNGIDLSHFPFAGKQVVATGKLRIVSVGRLVEFKGFANLIEACARLHAKQLDFSCEIIGDGPLREELEQLITRLGLDEHVTLPGSLSQERVFEELHRADIFALAAIVDRNGASDVFPTVIQEAMSASRPVVSTQLAGIPETVRDGETGFLVPPNDIDALTDALEKLMRDRDLRVRFGQAARRRIEQNFSIEATIQPLIELLDNSAHATTVRTQISAARPIAYLIDLWPDPQLPVIELELLEMERRQLGISAIVCRLAPETRFTHALEEAATSFQFLPDAMGIESIWQANRPLALQMENDRANETHRAPADIFLQQARFALALRQTIATKNISHVHAAGSGALLCGVMLKRMLGVTLSATIETAPTIPNSVIEDALEHCEGGRIADSRLLSEAGERFIFDRAGAGTFANKTLARLRGASGQESFWNEWADLLRKWSHSAPAHPITA